MLDNHFSQTLEMMAHGLTMLSSKHKT